MFESKVREYSSRQKMETTTGKVLSRLHNMKSRLCKTIKKTPQFCGGISNHNRTYCSPASFYSMTNYENRKLTESDETSSTNIVSDDTISSISGDSSDSGVSTLSEFSHNSALSSQSILNRTKTQRSSYLRCDPSIINYVSNTLLTTYRTELFLNEIDDNGIDESPSSQVPLAESSRRIMYDSDQTLIPDDEDEPIGPLTSTLIDGWYTISKGYTAIFRQDLTVRKNELVQVLRCTHPHWVWVRNEQSDEGFVPTDCLINC